MSMITFKNLLLEGVRETAAEDFLKTIITGTKWENKVYIAGGYVRDQILGGDPKDIDIVIDSKDGGIEFAEWITKKIGNYKRDSNPLIYPRFGTAKFNLNGVTHNDIDLSGIGIESVMPRSEEYVSGSRKPVVGFSSLKTDTERRDLTINSMYKNVSTGEVMDLTGKGKDDLKSGILRTPLDPDQTFEDDPLRMLRVVRFYAKYGYKLSSLDLLRSLKRNAHRLEDISNERIRDELDKMLVSVRPAKAIKLLKISGLLNYVIPEFKAAVGMSQNIHHKHDVFNHTLDVLSKTKPDILNRLMALFHDIGKTVTKSVTPTGVHFYGHEDAGKQMVIDIMTRLKYPNELTNAVALGVKNHMKLKHGGDDTVMLSDKTLRKFKHEMGNKLESLLDVIHADNISHSEGSSMPNQIENVRRRLESLEIESEKPNLPINGKDLINMGLKPGPLFTEILNDITEKWFENPNITKEDALSVVKKYL